MFSIQTLKKKSTLRNIFFAIATVAVVAITGMNVYSLYALRENTVELAKDAQKNQLEEFTSQVWYRFHRPFFLVRKIDMQHVENHIIQRGTFPHSFFEALEEAVSDSLFTDVYFSAPGLDGCNSPDEPLFKIDAARRQLTPVSTIPEYVCDGIGISKSLHRVNIDEWNWNAKVSFNSHRTMSLALIDLDDRSEVGHLTFVIDRDYLINGYLAKELRTQFGPSEETGLVVWLRDWVQRDILVSSDPNYVFDTDQYPIELRQRFNNSLEDWHLIATFFESPAIAASNSSLNRNLFVLGVAVFALFGALLFIFINARRERELAERQAGFLANITHELKTPLAVMQAAGENIADGRVKDGQRLRNYGEHIYRESVRLKKMIDKLLDTAKLDAVSSSAQLAPNQIDLLAREFFEANQPYIEGKGFTFLFEADENVPLTMVDADHIETILNNLVENAIKYSSREKWIKLSIQASGKKVDIIVQDRGDGIPKSAQKLVFNKFYRVENSLTAKTKGHGLGLSIVKNMVEQNSGSIVLDSEPGKGTTFTITFPALLSKEGIHPERAAQTPTAPLGKHVETKEYAK
ncbi:MAG: sensor histidine kinase [Balneolaceae bacterium]